VNEGEQRDQEQTASEQVPKKVSPKVWIACLSDYNAGHLHGAWVEADQEADDIWEGVNEVLRTSRVPGAEEWAIFDYEGFGPLRLSEYEAIERVSRLGRGIGEHGVAFAVFAGFLGGGEDELLDQFEDCYIGQWGSAEAYVDEFLDDVGMERILDEAVPEAYRDYVKFDTEALVRDMECEGSLLAVDDSEGGVFLFHPP
jgi:antirestriction protein